MNSGDRLGVPSGATESRSRGNSFNRNDNAGQISRLIDMGFTNRDLNAEALRRSNGDLNGAVSYLVRHQSGAAAPAAAGPAADPAAVTAIMGMGFKDEARVRNALKETHGDVPKAIQLLSQPAVAAAAPKPAQNNNLFGGDDLFGSAPAPAASKPQAQASSGADFFGAATAPAAANAGWGDDPFGMAPAAAKPAAANQTSADLFQGAPP